MRRLLTKVGAMLVTAIVGVVAANTWSGLKSSALFDKPDHEKTSASTIRSVDFANLTYSLKIGGLTKEVTLVNRETLNFRDNVLGERALLLGNPIYLDLTGDGEEDALVDLCWQFGPTDLHHVFYLFTVRDHQLESVWTFTTHGFGREKGALRTAYFQAHDFVLEILGENKITENSATLAEPVGCAVCYDFFTRVRFYWDGKSFRQKGEAEILPLSEN